MVDKVHTYGERDLALKINELIDALDAAAGGDVAWADIPDVPAALTSAQAAGTPSIRAIGATATTVVAGNDSRLTAGAAGVATVRALGTTGTTAAAGNDARLLTGSATAVNNAATFADLAAATTAYNTLLAALRTRGIITGA
jgi:hypothetical protein